MRLWSVTWALPEAATKRSMAYLRRACLCKALSSSEKAATSTARPISLSTIRGSATTCRRTNCCRPARSRSKASRRLCSTKLRFLPLRVQPAPSDGQESSTSLSRGSLRTSQGQGSRLDEVDRENLALDSNISFPKVPNNGPTMAASAE